ncbi:sortase [Rubidibacter lacunae KORDI 51-2]|uniref:Sortase n=1 Tax=Rubidibacter lacunae KORDI 51-2 TaxID=582515 RepID=U5DJF9_9CHRO|nr:sortase [Rubidibacter lacunae KORDI 51-2]
MANVRPACPEDGDAIVEIQLAAIAASTADHYCPQQIEALCEDKSHRRDYGEYLFVAERDGTALGFGALNGPRNTIHAIYVRPEYFRQGIGSQLLERLETEALRRDRPALYVCSSRYAEPFYRTCGFHKVGDFAASVRQTSIPCIGMIAELLPKRQPRELLAKRRWQFVRHVGLILVAILLVHVLL